MDQEKLEMSLDITPVIISILNFTKHWSLLSFFILCFCGGGLHVIEADVPLVVCLLSGSGLGSAWRPVEPGHPVARAQNRRKRVCFLPAGSAVKTWTRASAETCTGRTGHQQVSHRITCNLFELIRTPTVPSVRFIHQHQASYVFILYWIFYFFKGIGCICVYNKRLIVIYLILDIFQILVLSFIFIGAKIQMFLNTSGPCGTCSCITD